MGPDRNPLSMGADPNAEPGRPEGIGPERTDGIELRGIGWSGIEANESELSNDAALSRVKLLYGERSSKAVDRGVDALALMEAPEMVRNVDVIGLLSMVWSLVLGSGRM